MVIRKCISSVLLLVTIIVACSCVPNTAVKKSTEDTQSNDNSLTSLEDNEPTTESIFVPDYDVNSVAIDVTFDGIVDECLDITGFDDPRNSGEDHVYNDDLTYYLEYLDYIDDMSSPDPDGFVCYEPSEYEYHIERYFSLYDTSLFVYEFDSEEWAEVGFSMCLDSILKSEDLISIDRHESEGYYFVFYDDSYKVYYIVGNCIIFCDIYLVHNQSYSMYTPYMNICGELGLPISDEMTAEILG